MRSLVWIGGLVALGGMAWLFQGVDLAAGGSDTTALVGGTLCLIVGVVMVGFGMRSSVGPD